MVNICAITMVYNEPDFLPLWVKYYAGQVGAPNCYVIDHGTDDGSTDGYQDVSFIRLPRTPHNDDKRTALVSSIVSFLLSIYDVVIHTDADEIVFPDPRLYRSLTDYCERNQTKVVTAHGFEVLHIRGLEPDIDTSRPILEQRHWANFSAAMCKPAMVRKPVIWAPGFHCTTESVVFNDLFLFHLRWFDFNIAMRRLQRTRAQAWADPNAGGWQRVPDAQYEQVFANYGNIPRLEDCAFSPNMPPLNHLIDRFLMSQIGRENQTYRTELDIPTDKILRIPESFAQVF